MADKANESVVLSTRVRLARNLKDLPFPNMQSADQAQQVIDRTALALSRSDMKNDFALTYLRANSESENIALIEDHLISPDLVKASQRAAVFINKEKTLSIMVGEEDDIRIQAIMNGRSLNEALDLANKADDSIAENETYAFHDTLGYLTACPSNTGTGMRASLMLHLPALTVTHQIEQIGRAVSRLGLTIRGFYGEGSQASGSIYQLSNQVTLGFSENDIVKMLNDTADQIIEREMKARYSIYNSNKTKFSDKLMRSFGMLKYAMSIDSKELYKFWSDLRLAISLGIQTEITNETADKLLSLQPAELSRLAGKAMTPEERDIYRAQCVKNILNEQLP